MYNWSTDENMLKKDPRKYELWEFGQMANFGLDGRKFKEGYLREHLDEILLDPWRKRFLQLLIA